MNVIVSNGLTVKQVGDKVYVNGWPVSGAAAGPSRASVVAASFTFGMLVGALLAKLFT
jgi:hypothetical protein